MFDTRQPTFPTLPAQRLAVAGLLVFTLIVRGGVLWVMRGNLEQDPDAYREIAENLLIHGEFALGKPTGEYAVARPAPTAYRSPLYPVILSNLPAADGQHVSLVKVGAMHVLLGVMTVALTWITAQRLIGHWMVQDVGPAGLSKDLSDGSQTSTLRWGLVPSGPSGLWAAPLIAGAIVACDPILLNQQTLLMTETLAAFLAILSLWCLGRFDRSRAWFNAAMAGGCIGLAILCRPTFLPWMTLVGLTMLVVRGGSALRDGPVGNPQSALGVGWRVANLAALIMAAVAVTSPWAIRNFRRFGKPIITTTHGGYTLLLGNNPSFYDWLEKDTSGLPWTTPAINERHTHILGNIGLLLLMDSSVTQTVPQTEPEIDAKSYDVAIRSIRSRPVSFTKACLYRLGQLWSPLPNKLTANESRGRRLLRYATCAWYLGIYALAAVGICRLRMKMLQPPWIWGVLLCMAFTVVHTFYWTNLRMRAPFMPFVAMVAAAAIRPKAESSM
jgi:hypothetical protein